MFKTQRLDVVRSSARSCVLILRTNLSAHFYSTTQQCLACSQKGIFYATPPTDWSPSHVLKLFNHSFYTVHALHQRTITLSNTLDMSAVKSRLKWISHEIGIDAIIATGRNAYLVILARACRMFAFGANALILGQSTMSFFPRPKS